MNRILLAGILAGAAMFLWNGIAHMALPLGEAGIREIPQEQGLLSAMQSTMPAPGLYLFPAMPPDHDQAKYMQKVASGPSGLLLYLPRRDFNFGAALGTEFATELVQALIVAWLLSLTRVGTFTGRLVFVAVLGLAACVATNASYWNWYSFPATYTVAYMFTVWMGYVFAGAALAAMKIGGGPVTA